MELLPDRNPSFVAAEIDTLYTRARPFRKKRVPVPSFTLVILASYLPARRVAAVDPVETLRAA
ncbi:MAG TPA: hypothetical protein VH702_07785 [Vicinamibacterales bacterium]|jgi:ABC-type lipoprotein release transport system permease subunit